jgi:hypothetical protein
MKSFLVHAYISRKRPRVKNIANLVMNLAVRKGD